MKTKNKWTLLSAVLIASILLIQPTQPIKIGMMIALYWLIKAIRSRNIQKEIFISEIIGLALSFIWWSKRWRDMFIYGASLPADSKTNIFSVIKQAMPASGGTATRVYTLNDFLIANPYGGINVHIGWGLFISFLFLVGILYCFINYKTLLKQKNVWILISIAWFVFTFLGVNSMTFKLPIGIFAFRFWLLLAIPVALLSSLGFWYIFEWQGNFKALRIVTVMIISSILLIFGLPNKLLPFRFWLFLAIFMTWLFSLGIWYMFKWPKNFKILRIIGVIIIVSGILLTSGYQKYNQNHEAVWPPGVVWNSNEEIQGYIWLKTLPTNTKVFSYSKTDRHIMGFDMYSCEWCDTVVNFRSELLDKDVNQLHTFLKANKYEYLVISQMSYKKLANDSVENSQKISYILSELQKSEKFSIIHQTKGAIIFKVL